MILKLVLLSPFVAANTGNFLTAERIKNGLIKSSIDAFHIPLKIKLETFNNEIKLLKNFKPDVLHFFNGVKCSKVFEWCYENLKLPLVVTVTGTDAFSNNEEEKKVFSRILKFSRAVTVFHQVIKKRLINVYNISEGKIFVVPQSISPELIKVKSVITEEKFPLFFLPAGIRGVKDIIYSLKPLSLLQKEVKNLKLILAGHVIEKEYFTKLRDELKKYDFAEYLGDIQHIEIPKLYKKCWVVLNTSVSEGGMPNTLIEGMFYKKPILARAIEGNTTIIKDGFNGFTFKSEDELVKKARLLINSKSLRDKMGHNGYTMLLKEFSFEREINGYRDIYKKCLA